MLFYGSFGKSRDFFMIRISPSTQPFEYVDPLKTLQYALLFGRFVRFSVAGVSGHLLEPLLDFGNKRRVSSASIKSVDVLFKSFG